MRPLRVGVVGCSLRGMSPLTSYPIKDNTVGGTRQLQQGSQRADRHRAKRASQDVERGENGLHLDGGTGYEVDKPGGVKHGKQYTSLKTVSCNRSLNTMNSRRVLRNDRRQSLKR